MPEVKLLGDHFHDSLLVQAVMLWPNDDQEQLRQQFVAAQEANRLVRSRQRELTVSADLLNLLLDTPSWQTLCTEIEIRTRRAILAGHVLASMFVSFLIEPYIEKTASRKKPTTLAMACDGATKWAAEMGSYGDGMFLPTDRRKWETSFYEFRSVSHLWAAKELLPQFFDHQGHGCFSETALPDLLRLAATIYKFGTTFQMAKKSKQGSNILLPADELWLIDGISLLTLADEQIEPLLGTDFAKFVRQQLNTAEGLSAS